MTATLIIHPLVWATSKHGWQHAGNYRLRFNGYRWLLSHSDAAIGIVTSHETEAVAKEAADSDHQYRISTMVSIAQGDGRVGLGWSRFS